MAGLGVFLWPRPDNVQLPLTKWADLSQMTDEEVVERFRLTRRMIQWIIDEYKLSPYRVKCKKEGHVSEEVQVLSTLYWLATGAFYREIGGLMGITKSSVCRAVHKVTTFLADMEDRWIFFPQTRDEKASVIQGFFRMAQFPNVIGAIDGTHIRIKRPKEEEEAYVNRKFFHSVNVQICCDADNRILDIDCTRPGSSHDGAIFRNSLIAEHLAEGTSSEGWLLGDSGYGCTTRLLTPVGHPAERAEQRYNMAHRTARSVVERTIGIMKSRFRCLDQSGGALQLDTDNVSAVIMSCAVLHNMCISERVPYDENEAMDAAAAPDIEDIPGMVEEDLAAGLEVRRALIHGFFRR